MKNTALTLALLLFAGLLSAQTTFPNGDFEQWTDDKPNGWDASNYQVLTISIRTVFPDTAQPVSGDYSVRLKTNTFNLITIQPTIPGIITLGNIVVNTSTFSGHIEGGIPFTGRPLRLQGHIYPNPSAGDSSMIALGFSKWNGTNRDTIGAGTGWFATSKAGWETFDIPITFTTAGAPDSMNIIISSSALGTETMVSGSEVKVDDLSLDYGNVIVKLPLKDDGFTVWADEGRHLYYQLHSEKHHPVQLEIYNINGALMHGEKITQKSIPGICNLQDIAPGVYIISIITSDNQMLTRKFVLR